MKSKKINKYVFIDTSIFLDILYCNTSSEDLDKILKWLSDSKITLILPRVIMMEILKEFKLWNKNLLESITQKLKIDLILDVTEKDKTGSGKDRKKKTDNSILIDKITKTNREGLIKNVSDFYKSLETKLNSVFTNSNTKVIELSDSIIMRGIERSLLKKAPSTKLDKKTEHQHLKDVDCIAFESIIDFFNSDKNKIDNDALYILTSDSDYFEENGNLRDDIMFDLSKFKKKNIKYTQSLDEVFIKKQVRKKVINEKAKASLFSEDYALVESLEKQNIGSI